MNSQEMVPEELRSGSKWVSIWLIEDIHQQASGHYLGCMRNSCGDVPTIARHASASFAANGQLHRTVEKVSPLSTVAVFWYLEILVYSEVDDKSIIGPQDICRHHIVAKWDIKGWKCSHERWEVHLVASLLDLRSSLECKEVRFAIK